jgi:hypothetical protein
VDQAWTEADFTALIDLSGLQPGLHRIPVVARTDLELVQINEVQPATLDIELALQAGAGRPSSPRLVERLAVQPLRVGEP